MKQGQGILTFDLSKNIAVFQLGGKVSRYRKTEEGWAVLNDIAPELDEQVVNLIEEVERSGLPFVNRKED